MRAVKWTAIVVAALLAVAPMPAWWVERWYARRWYAAVQPRLTAFSDLFPFSLFDLLCVAALAAVIGWWWRTLRRAPRGTRWRTVRRLAFDTTAAAAVVYLWFAAAWGLNYRREKIAARLDYDERRITRDALIAVAARAAEQATSVREHVRGEAEVTAALAGPFAETLAALSVGHVRPSRPKWSIFALLWKRTGVDGMTDPFFLESLVRTDLLPFERPFVVAHEWAHLAGFADESEASFVSFLTCLRGTPDAQYSAWLLMYVQVSNDLPDADRAAVRKRLGPGPIADLRALSEKYRREVVPVARDAGREVYDRFLKANRLESGVRSYDEVTRLLAGTRFEPDWKPVLR